MEWLEVRERVAAGEGRKTEFKRLFEKNAVGKAICAFANGEGGVVVLGVDDAGAIIGVKENPESLQERITAFLQSGCSAPVVATCGCHQAPAGWVHWITVPRMRGLGPLHHGGRVWIRRERSSVEPSSSELEEMFHALGFFFTESQMILDAGVEAIDSSLFRSFLESRGVAIASNLQPEIEVDLRNQRVIDEFGKNLHPTLYGLMVFGRDPQRYLGTTNFFIQCVAYARAERGPKKYSISEAKGTLDKQVESAMTWFRSLGRREIYRGLCRQDLSFVPEEALREALVNAVIHRNYALTGSKVMFEVFDSHIEITSPGSLPGQMTVQRVRAGGGPRSRNESMANAMLIHGFMKERGRGWLLMRYQMREFNGTEPELANDKSGRFVRTTFRLDEPAA